MASVRIESNIKDADKEMHEAIMQALEMCAQVAEGHAIVNVPVDTGNLKQSITHKVDEDEQAAYIGTNNEYALYVELGTGIYATGGGGRRTPWKYVASPSSKYYEGGKVHITQGQKPVHFLKRAITEHQEEYKEIIKRCIESGMSKYSK